MANTMISLGTIPGSDPNSVYQIIANTTNYVVGIRRIAYDVFRFRLERHDKQPLKCGVGLFQLLVQTGFKLGNEGIYVSMTAHTNNVSRLLAYTVGLLIAEDTKLKDLPLDLAPEGAKLQAMFDGAQAAPGNESSGAEQGADETPTEPVNAVTSDVKLLKN